MYLLVCFLEPGGKGANSGPLFLTLGLVLDQKAVEDLEIGNVGWHGGRPWIPVLMISLVSGASRSLPPKYVQVKLPANAGHRQGD
jgi:hypothetical protein